jgi:hypothetical protein
MWEDKMKFWMLISELFRNDKALVILIAGLIAGGLIIKLPDPSSVITPIITGMFGVVTGAALAK